MGLGFMVWGSGVHKVSGASSSVQTVGDIASRLENQRG